MIGLPNVHPPLNEIDTLKAIQFTVLIFNQPKYYEKPD